MDFDDGKPVIGVGSDLDPFVAGFTSKILLEKLKQFQNIKNEAMLHVDCTYKITKEAYPLLVVGVSDISRLFHLLGVFFVSQTTEIIIKYYIDSLFDAVNLNFTCLADWKPSFTMTDSDPALINALRSRFGESTKYLNCYFHLKKNVRDYVRSECMEHYSTTMKDIDALHYTKNSTDFQNTCFQLDAKWRSEGLEKFANYVKSNLLSTPFNNWACYHSPTGYAKTNNPIENFNGDLKRNTLSCFGSNKLAWLYNKNGE